MHSNLIKRYPQIKPISIIIFSVLILDQVTKYLARIFLQPKYSIAVLDNFFRLTYVENPGIAFGVRINNKVFFTVLTILAVILIFYYLFLLREQKILRFAFALILGGAFGNLIDRFFYGSVVDFFDFEFFNIHIPPFNFLFFHFGGYTMDRWPVFNIADSAVTVGMLLIIINAIWGKSTENKPDAIPENH